MYQRFYQPGDKFHTTLWVGCQKLDDGYKWLLWTLLWYWCVKQEKICRQETPNSVGGRKSMYQIQARLAMEQEQMRLDMIATAAVGPSIWTYIERPTRSSYKNFIWASLKNFHTSTNAEELQDLNAGTFEEDLNEFKQDPHKIFPQGPARDHVRTPRGFQEGLSKSSTRSCKGLWQHRTRISTRTSQKDL